MIAYLSGPMRGKKDYKKAFNEAAEKLKKGGATVINPAGMESVAGDLPYEAMMKLDLAMLAQADTIVMLSGWEKSLGANRELGFAMGAGKQIVEFDKIEFEEGGDDGRGTDGRS